MYKLTTQKKEYSAAEKQPSESHESRVNNIRSKKQASKP